MDASGPHWGISCVQGIEDPNRLRGCSCWKGPYTVCSHTWVNAGLGLQMLPQQQGP